MNKTKTLRLALALAVAAAVAVPLVAQVKNAQKQAAEQQAAATAPPPAAEPTTPTTLPTVDPNKVIATEGDVTCNGAEFSAAAATLPPQYQPLLAQPAMRKRLVDSILQYKLLAAEAKRRGVDQKPEVKQQLAMQEDQILAQALAKQIQGSDDAANRQYFDSHKSNFDNVKARHILIRTPESPVPAESGKKELTDAEAKAKADQIKQRLDKGEDFSKIAKAESDDKGSGLQGGDLGTFSPWKMDATFSKAALALQPNQISQPVKTQFGYHIIQLLEDKPRTYDEAKSEIGQARMQSLLTELKNQKTNYDPVFFGSASDSGPTTQPAPASSLTPAQPQGGKRRV